MNLFIGLMSGTSMDGIDAVLVDHDNNNLLASITRCYSNQTKVLLDKLLSERCASLASLAQLNTLIGREFAAAVHELISLAQVPARKVTAIGSHGQTIAHDVEAEVPYTVQLGCPHTIAEMTGIPVVADFRTRDVVLGGRGAPFAPLYHQALFSEFDSVTAIVNVGGIANISFVQQGKATTGFDTGPGNCIMDNWINKQLNQPYDKNGAWAAKGVVNQRLLANMMSDNYFTKPGPKSVGKEYFSSVWLRSHVTMEISPEDVQATLLALTAHSICEAIDATNHNPSRLFVCGGGAHNQELLRVLKANLPDIDVASTQTVNLDPDYIEAMMFAWLAEKTIHNTPLELKSITGSSKPAVLGVVYSV